MKIILNRPMMRSPCQRLSAQVDNFGTCKLECNPHQSKIGHCAESGASASRRQGAAC